MFRICFCTLVLLTFVPLLQVSADQVTLEPSQDAFVCDCIPGATNPMLGNQYLAQGRYSACYNRTFIEWDLSSIPTGSIIDSAEFRIYCASFYGSPTGQMEYFCVIEDWNENTVTYNNRPDHTTNGAIFSSNWPTASTWNVVDVTTFVIDWFDGSLDNYGMLCHSSGSPSTSDCAYYSSRVSSSSYRPRLVVTFTPAGSLEPDTWGGLKAQ